MFCGGKSFIDVDLERSEILGLGNGVRFVRPERFELSTF